MHHVRRNAKDVVKLGLALSAVAIASLSACGGSAVVGEETLPEASFRSEGGGSWVPVGSSEPTGLENPQNLAAFWTGREVLVVVGATGEGTVVHLVAYDPRADTWRAPPPAPLSWRSGYDAVWTDETLIVWGASTEAGDQDDGAQFNPDTNRWMSIARSPLARRFGHTAVWTGEEMLVWGGAYGDFAGERSDGAAYDPDTDRWRLLAESPLVGRYLHSAVWTGKEMLLWGGSDDAETEGFHGEPSRYLADGAAYDPASDSWRRLADAPFAPRAAHTAVWTGSEMLVWDGIEGADYDPASDTWRRLPTSPLSARYGHTAVWTDEEMLIWGGNESGRGTCFLADGAAYSPKRDAWTPLPDSPLDPRDRHAAVWTGNAMVVWGGCCIGSAYRADGALFEPGAG